LKDFKLIPHPAPPLPDESHPSKQAASYIQGPPASRICLSRQQRRQLKEAAKGNSRAHSAQREPSNYETNVNVLMTSLSISDKKSLDRVEKRCTRQLNKLTSAMGELVLTEGINMKGLNRTERSWMLDMGENPFVCECGMRFKDAKEPEDPHFKTGQHIKGVMKLSILKESCGEASTAEILSLTKIQESRKIRAGRPPFRCDCGSAFWSEHKLYNHKLTNKHKKKMARLPSFSKVSNSMEVVQQPAQVNQSVATSALQETSVEAEQASNIAIKYSNSARLTKEAKIELKRLQDIVKKPFLCECGMSFDSEKTLIGHMGNSIHQQRTEIVHQGVITSNDMNTTVDSDTFVPMDGVPIQMPSSSNPSSISSPFPDGMVIDPEDSRGETLRWLCECGKMLRKRTWMESESHQMSSQHQNYLRLTGKGKVGSIRTTVMQDREQLEDVNEDVYCCYDDEDDDEDGGVPI
jgi:hypothetical protein